MKKSVNLNGEKIKVNFEMIQDTREKIQKRILNKQDGIATSNVTFIINNVEYKNAFKNTFTSNCRTFRYTEVYECNKTGKTFKDNHKNLIEYLLNK